jgi:hypothetical protein
MSKILLIKNKVEFVKGFLVPISKISESAVLEIKNNNLHCLVSTSDNSVIYHSFYKVDGDLKEGQTFNCSDIKKLIKAIDNVKKQDISFALENNNLSYKDESIRFKYHLLEDNIIKKPKISLEKLKDTKFNSSFVLTNEKVKELVKGSIFSSDSNKIYITINEDGVYAELTDKTRHNIDSITFNISNEYDGDFVDSIVLSFEIFRIIDVSNYPTVNVKINNKLGIVIFELNNNYNKMTYIMSSLTK